MTTVIRRAELSDAERLGQLHAECWRELYTQTLPTDVLAELGSDVMTQLWRRFVSRGAEYRQYVVEVNGIVIGFVGFGPGRDEDSVDEREIYFIFVHPDYQRAGFGTMLMQAEQDPAYLWISEHNRSAQKFYRRLGLDQDNRSRVGALFGTRLPEIRMSR